MLPLSNGFQTRPACQLKNWLSSLTLLRALTVEEGTALVLASVSKVS